MKIIIFAMIISLALGASLMDFACPDTCTCRDNHQIRCRSYIFIKKLLPKQMTSIVHLSLKDSSLSNIDPKLKYLKNLEHLDLSYNDIDLPTQFPYLPKLKSLNLSHNHLKDIKLMQLPKNLEILDLSSNAIVHFPSDYKQLKLRQLYLQKNQLDCDCHSLSVYEDILNQGILIPKPLTCYYPKEFRGRFLHTVNCSQITDYLLNSMLGDEAGSGASLNAYDETDTNVPIIEDENEYIPANTTHQANEEEEEEEIEGSGFAPLLDDVPPPKACHFNCSTVKPLGIHDEPNASPLPSLKDQLGILGEDLGIVKSTSTTTEATRTTSTTTETSPMKEVSEPIFVQDDKNKEVETFPTNNTILKEMERASVSSKESNPYFIFVVLGLVTALVVFLVIYYISKKRTRSRARRNKSLDNGMNGEEMKPLGKSAAISRPIEVKQPPIENGEKHVEEQTPLLTSNQNGIHKEGNGDVELRNNKKDLLTPQLERVTIKVGEIPDSIPKTPLLVHRQLNSDGEITTTVYNNN